MKLLHGIFVSLLAAVVIGTFGWAWKLNVDVALMRQQINQMAADKQKDVDQDRTLKMLWKYGAWAEGNINRVFHKLGMEPPERPRFD